MPGFLTLLPLLALLLVPAASAMAQSARAEPACGAPAELLQADEPLPAVGRALVAGELRVLVVGSASARGPGASGPEAAWPARLGAVLEARRPGLSVRVAVRGGQGATAAHQLAMITEELRLGPFDLLIWQTGTIEAVRGLDVGEFVATLNSGLELVAARRADAMLMDPQFSRFMRANADLGPYRAALRLVATAMGVPLFRRYDLMHHWAETERVDVERASRADRVAVVDKLNACLADALATQLLAARR